MYILLSRILGGIAVAPLLSVTLFANGFTVDADSFVGNYHGRLTIDSVGAVSFGFTDVPSGTWSSVNLLALSEYPGELYWYGSASFHSAGGSAGDVVGGGGGGGFLPGHPTSNSNNHDSREFAYGTWDGFSPFYTEGAVWFAYDFPVFWDGENLEGEGTWSIKWSENRYLLGTHTPYVEVPDRTSIVYLLTGTLVVLFRIAARRRGPL